jgi:hypothetical protein
VIGGVGTAEPFFRGSEAAAGAYRSSLQGVWVGDFGLATVALAQPLFVWQLFDGYEAAEALIF